MAIPIIHTVVVPYCVISPSALYIILAARAVIVQYNAVNGGDAATCSIAVVGLR